MINPLASQILPSISRHEKSAQTSDPNKATEGMGRAARPPRPAPEGLAASIMSDGGLGFLRSRLEDKLGALFEKAAADNPELAAAGPGAFFDTSVDVSPEATADRIVGFALGMKGIYSRQNSELSADELATGFENEIRSGINEGFAHARNTLGSLDLLSGLVQDNVDVTWDLVQQKLEDFFKPSTAASDE